MRHLNNHTSQYNIKIYYTILKLVKVLYFTMLQIWDILEKRIIIQKRNVNRAKQFKLSLSNKSRWFASSTYWSYWHIVLPFFMRTTDLNMCNRLCYLFLRSGICIDYIYIMKFLSIGNRELTFSILLYRHVYRFPLPTLLLNDSDEATSTWNAVWEETVKERAVSKKALSSRVLRIRARRMSFVVGFVSYLRVHG